MGSSAIRRPWRVTAPAPSSAPTSRQELPRLIERRRGRRVEPSQPAGGIDPPAATSSASAARSACRISGVLRGTRLPWAPSDHSRMHTPGPCGRPGRDAGRRTRARPAGSPGASCRCGHRTGGRAQTRCRPPRGCLQWSGWSRRCWWPARSCADPPAPGRWPGPAPRGSGCRKAGPASTPAPKAMPAAAPAPGGSPAPRAEKRGCCRSRPRPRPAPLPQPPAPGADRRAADVARLHREQPAFAGDDRRVRRAGGNGPRLQGGRHHQQLQVRVAARPGGPGRSASPRSASRWRSWNSSKITSPTPVRAGSLLHHARQDAFGHHLDAGVRTDARVHAHAVAHGPAHRLAQQPRHAHRGGARRQAPRLEHDDALPGEPRLAQEGRRHPRGLARAGRRHQDGSLPGAQRRGKLGQNAFDREPVVGRIGCRGVDQQSPMDDAG